MTLASIPFRIFSYMCTNDQLSLQYCCHNLLASANFIGMVGLCFFITLPVIKFPDPYDDTSTKVPPSGAQLGMPGTVIDCT